MLPVTTTSGPVIGIKDTNFSNVTAYRGIPYAADTGGDNRWRLPISPPSWAESRLCDKFGPFVHKWRPPGPEREQSEDCLSVNIWTTASSPASKLPVYVWIYGGRFIFGAGSEPTFDGAYLASTGIVVVTINYRLGVFGFLAHPELSRESPYGASGNYGIHDQLFALQWVKANIASFGGDPNTITIGGQSAGSASCTLHLYSPLSRGLFSRVIVESGMRTPSDPLISALAPSYRTRETAESQGIAYVKEKGADSIAELREATVADLLVGNNRNDDNLWGSPPFFRPCLDGHIFPRTYQATLDGGYQSDVPVLTGHNNHEGGVYTDERFDLDDHNECAAVKFGALVDRFHELYPMSEYDTPLEAWNAAARDNSRITLDLWAKQFASKKGSPTFAYHFTQIPPTRQGVPPPGWGQLKSKGYTYNKGPMVGAFHGSELWYAFNNFYATRDREWTEQDRQVGARMSRWWVNFIKRGDVNAGENDSEEFPVWPKGGQGEVMEIGLKSQVTPLAVGNVPAKVQFWKSHFENQALW